jgi:hypothetical protein
MCITRTRDTVHQTVLVARTLKPASGRHFKELLRFLRPFDDDSPDTYTRSQLTIQSDNGTMHRAKSAKHLDHIETLKFGLTRRPGAVWLLAAERTWSR